LLKTVKTTRWISGNEFQTLDWQSEKTSICVESTARYDKLVSVCGIQMKPRGDFRY